MLPTKTRGGQRDQVEQTTGEKIKANQQRLHAQRQADGLKKWENGDGGNANGKDKAIKRFESYRREEQLPRDVEQRRVRCAEFFRGIMLIRRSASTSKSRQSSSQSTARSYRSISQRSKTSQRRKKGTRSFCVSTFSLLDRLLERRKIWWALLVTG